MNDTQIPFNLDKALAGEPVITRAGEKVTQLTLFDLEFDEPLLAGVIAGKRFFTWRKNGGYLDSHKPSKFDLFMAPKIMQRWVRITKTNKLLSIPGGYDAFAEIGEAVQGKAVKWRYKESKYLSEPVLLCEWAAKK